VRCRPRKTTTLGKTLCLAEFTTRVLAWIRGRPDEELERDGRQRIDIVGKRWRRACEALRRAVPGIRLRRDRDLDQRLPKPKACDSCPFTIEEHVARRHHPVMDALARRTVDCDGQLSRALQDFCNRTCPSFPHHRVHGGAGEM